MTATRTQIIDTFLNTPQPKNGTRWDVDDDTYINHIHVTVDCDYHMGYLLEIVERDTSVVSFLVVVTFYGPDRLGRWNHDSEWYPDPIGTFFDRSVGLHTVGSWAVEKVYGLIDSWQDRRDASKCLSE